MCYMGVTYLVDHIEFLDLLLCFFSMDSSINFLTFFQIYVQFLFFLYNFYKL